MVCTCTPKGQTHPGLHQNRIDQQVEGCDSPALLCTCEIPPGIFCPSLGPSAQKRCGPLGAGPEDNERDGTLLLQ